MLDVSSVETTDECLLRKDLSLQLPIAFLATPSMFECLLCVICEARCLSGMMAERTLKTFSTLSACQHCIDIKGCCHETWTANCLHDCRITAARQRNVYQCMRRHCRGLLASRASSAWGFVAQAQRLSQLAEAALHVASQGRLCQPFWWLTGQRPWVQPWT